ncbi:hypothetical protein ACKWTF_016164 [Chironomus riparius]
MRFILFSLLIFSIIFVTSQQEQPKCGENEEFFTCESSSRNSCKCLNVVKPDCNTGCMCKNGYCKFDRNGPCVRRQCKHPYYD